MQFTAPLQPGVPKFSPFRLSPSLNFEALDLKKESVPEIAKAMAKSFFWLREKIYIHSCVSLFPPTFLELHCRWSKFLRLEATTLQQNDQAAYT